MSSVKRKIRIIKNSSRGPEPQIKKIEDSFESNREMMERKATNYFAANTLSKFNFPNKDSMPRFFPTPFNNFGHYFLFDYERYLRILWDTVELFKSHISFTSRYLPWMVLGGSLILTIFFPGGIFFSIIAFFITKVIIRNNLRKKFADIRADLIRKLLDDSWYPSMSNNIPQRLHHNFAHIGAGDIENSNKPVAIIFNDQHPFPGFGKLQFDYTILCRPEDKEKIPSIPEKELFEQVVNDIKEDLKKLELKNFNTGHLISIHSDSLSMESKWLDHEKIPRLYFHSNDPYEYDKIDPDASARIFFAVQILFPKYMTAATFFVRVYKAENSAACQISVATLGPPLWKKDFFQKRLAKHRAEKKGISLQKTLMLIAKAFIPIPGKSITNMQLFKELRKQRELGDDRAFFSQNPKLRNIIKLDLLSSKTYLDSDYIKERQEIIDESIAWPGQFYYPLNWRERNSLTFPADFFGRPEAIDSVRTLNDQISRSVLDSFEKAEYDVSDYKDKDGNYSIHADKIEQLVVGKKIEIKSGPNTPKSKD